MFAMQFLLSFIQANGWVQPHCKAQQSNVGCTPL
jgi:hypothetical protein